MHSSNFQHQGRNLEARAEPGKDGWVVRVYEGGKPATNTVYGVSQEPIAYAPTSDVPEKIVQHLMRHAEKDITHGLVDLLDM